MPKRPRPLTVGEIEIVRLVARGWTNEQIAKHLSIHLPTLRGRISALYHLIDVVDGGGDRNGSQGVSRVRLTIWARENGIIAGQPRPTRCEELVEEAFEVCRGLVLKRPILPLRDRAVRLIREADADLVADETPRAA